MDTRNLNNGNLNNASANNGGSMSFHLRGGTSGVHMRNFSDIEPIKTKNKSFFNKYKESRKDIVSHVNQQVSHSSVGDSNQLSNQSQYKRPRTNSPFPNMRVSNIQYSQFNQEMINKLNQSENLVLQSDLPHQTFNINSITSQFIISPQQTTFIPNIKNENIMTPPYPMSQNQSSVNSSQQNTATNQNSKAFFQRTDPSINNYKSQKVPAFVLSPNQYNFGNNEQNNSQVLEELQNRGSNVKINYNINTSHIPQSNTNNLSPQSRNKAQISFQQSQSRSLSTEQSNVNSRNIVSSEHKQLSNNENIEMFINKNIKLEPIGRINQRHQRNRSLNENNMYFPGNSSNQAMNINQSLRNYSKDIQYNSIQNNNTNGNDVADIINSSHSRFKEESHYKTKINDQEGGSASFLNSTMNYNNPIFKTADKSTTNNTFQSDDANSSFRVENRRARPKIIKNVNNICNIFIFQNNNQLAQSTQVSQQKKRRKNSNQRILDSIQNQQHHEILEKDELPYNQLQVQKGKSTDIPDTKDQYYFTFFKESQEPTERTSDLQQAHNISLFNRPETILTGQNEILNSRPFQNINTGHISNTTQQTSNVSRAQLPSCQLQTAASSSIQNNNISSDISQSNGQIVYFQQPFKRPLKKPQSPKKLLPQCFLDANTSDLVNSRSAQKQHSRTNSETPQLMNGVKNLNIDDILSSQSNHYKSNSNNNVAKLVMKNNKIYVPQKVIHRLNERTVRSDEQTQLMIKEVLEK